MNCKQIDELPRNNVQSFRRAINRASIRLLTSQFSYVSNKSTEKDHISIRSVIAHRILARGRSHTVTCERDRTSERDGERERERCIECNTCLHIIFARESDVDDRLDGNNL